MGNQVCNLKSLAFTVFTIGGRILTLVEDSVKLRSVLEIDPKKWNTLGLRLGFTQEMLHSMASSAGGMESYLHKVIMGWLSGDANQQPTLEAFLAALRHPEMGEEILAAKLLEGILLELPHFLEYSCSIYYRSVPSKHPWVLYHSSLNFTTLGTYSVYWALTMCQNTHKISGWSQCTIVIVMAACSRLPLASTPISHFSQRGCSFVKQKLLTLSLLLYGHSSAACCR